MQINIQPDFARLIIGLILPIAFISFQYIINLIIGGSDRREGDNKYRLWLKRPNGMKSRLQPISLEDIKTSIQKNQAEVIDLDELDPKLFEISFGIDFLVTAMSALIISYFSLISQSQESQGRSELRDVAFFALLALFVATMAVIIMLQQTKSTDDQSRRRLISISNLIGFAGLLASFLLLGNSII